MAKRLLSLLILAAAVGSPLQAASPIEELFQKALIKESVQRDLDGAIHIYQQVIDEAEQDPATTGEARLRIGICFEKLGKMDEAEDFLRQVVATPRGVSSDVLQQARTHLRRIETEHLLVSGSSTTDRGSWVREFQPSRFSLLVGPAALWSHKGFPLTAVSASLRYRIFESTRTTNWFLEAGGTVPIGDSTVATQAESFQSTTDNASLSLSYQTFFGVMGELPHGQQAKIIPEIGTGLDLTAAKINTLTLASSGSESQKTIRPYVQLGFHFFPNEIVSFLLQTRYLSTPYAKTVAIASPAHTQTFDFPSSQWTFSAAVQIKLGQREFVLRHAHE